MSARARACGRAGNGVLVLALLALAAGMAARPAGAAQVSQVAQVAHDARHTPTYTSEDFARFDKIDAHVHVNGPAAALMARARADGFRILAINVDYPDFPPVAQQLALARELVAAHPGQVAFVGSFTVEDFAGPAWPQSAMGQIDAAAEAGAVGIKIWKNIGLALRDTQGHYVMPDDARLAPVIAHIADRQLVLFGHQAEPRNCWLPFDQMTVRSDREYFREHPQYHMYAHPEMPSHESILAARDRLLEAHPKLPFVGVHLASLEWDVREVARFLDRFPQAQVDLAARMVHLEYQAVTHRRRVRDFLLRYQDRILYGTDLAVGPQAPDEAEIAQVHQDWLRDWQFLTSADAMRTNEFPGTFRGLALPRTALEKIYAGNARRLLPGAFPVP